MFGNSALEALIEQDMEEEEDEFLVIREFFEANKRKRLWKWRHGRLNWEGHLEQERHTGRFDSKYHLPEENFNVLVGLLTPMVLVDVQKSMNSTSGNLPIYPELVVATGLRFMGGELPKSLEDIVGMSKSSISRILSMFLDAVDSCNLLEFELPDLEDPDEIALKATAAGFQAKSTSCGLFDGVVGAIDGWLCCTGSPRDADITNKRAYYSGHYS